MSWKGHGGTTVKTWIGPKSAGGVVLAGGFRPNAGGAISAFRGPSRGMFTVSYAATGLYTVTFSAGVEFPSADLPQIILSESMADVSNTNRFKALNKGGWVNASRSFIVAAWQDTAAFAVPSDAANWIDFVILGATKT